MVMSNRLRDEQYPRNPKAAQVGEWVSLCCYRGCDGVQAVNGLFRPKSSRPLRPDRNPRAGRGRGRERECVLL